MSLTPPRSDASRPRIEVVAGILWRAGRFLAVRRPEGKPLAGYWEFPGGKVEPGETLEQALTREFREELGLTPLSAVLWREVSHDYAHALVRLHFFQIPMSRGAPVALEGHALAWFTPEAALLERFLPADTEIVAALTKAENRPDALFACETKPS